MFRVIIAIVLVGSGVYSFLHRNDNSGSSASSELQLENASVASLQIELEVREKVLAAMRASKQQAIQQMANPPKCGGKPMQYTVTVDVNDQEEQIKQEIAELRQAIARAK